MPRTRARFTQEELGRAIRAAKAEGLSVRVNPDGSIEIVEKGMDITPRRPIETRAVESL